MAAFVLWFISNAAGAFTAAKAKNLLATSQTLHRVSARRLVGDQLSSNDLNTQRGQSSPLKDFIQRQ